MIENCPEFSFLKGVKTIGTIHNGEYQGWMGWEKFHYLPEVNAESGGALEWNNCINPLASAVKCCWKYTTVSPSYLEELHYKAHGLEFLFELEKHKGVGILNGIDVDVWNPETDAMLSYNYQRTTVQAGKEDNKKEICEKFSLDPTKPLFTAIRLLKPP